MNSEQQAARDARAASVRAADARRRPIAPPSAAMLELGMTTETTTQPATLVYSTRRTLANGTQEWDVLADTNDDHRPVLGTVTKHGAGSYTATVGGFEIGDNYETMRLAVAAVMVTAARIAAL